MALFSIDILGLTSGSPKASDQYIAVDVTDPTMSTIGTDKKYQLATIFNFIVHGLGFSTLPPCDAASTVNYNAVYNNGIGGINATLTDSSGTFLPFTIDGIPGVVSSLTTPHPYLIKNQTNPAENGIYLLTQNGNGISLPWILIRASYFNSPANIINGSVTMITGGLTQASTVWQLSETGTVVVGTTPLNWIPFALFTSFLTLPLQPQFGGTGVANSPTSTITLGGSLQTIGSFSTIFNIVGPTNVTFPVSGTLATTSQLPVFPITVPQGGTGDISFTPFSIITGGTTSTGNMQNVVGVGTLNQVLVSQGAGALPIWSSVPGVVPAALTEVNDTNVTMTLGGTPTTALLQAVSMTLGWTGQLGETRGGTAQGTYILGDTLYASGVNTLAKLAGNITTTKQYLSQTGTGAVSAAPVWAAISGSDITVNDTNVTLTLGGSPTTALLRAASLTLGWTGQLAVPRGGTGNSTFTAFSVICAGTTATGVFQNVVGLGSIGQVLTSAGPGALPAWTNAPGTGTVNSGLINQLAWYAAAGTAVSGLTTANDGLLVTSNTGVPSILAGPGTTGNVLQSNAAAAPSFSTATYPSTSGTSGTILRSNGTNWVNSTSTFADTYSINTILYNASANTVSGLATANSSILVTSAGGVPSWSTTVPAFTTASITFSPTTGGIVGTTTNDNTASGNVGQFVSSVISSGAPVSFSNGVAKDLTSISLTAGDWDVWGNLTGSGSGANIAAIVLWISSTSATQPDLSLLSVLGGTGLLLSNVGFPAPSLRFSLSGTTTVYISAAVSFGSGTATCSGGIYARRRR